MRASVTMFLVAAAALTVAASVGLVVLARVVRAVLQGLG